LGDGLYEENPDTTSIEVKGHLAIMVGWITYEHNLERNNRKAQRVFGEKSECYRRGRGISIVEGSDTTARRSIPYLAGCCD
jgi:hypothetical protein